MKSTFYLVYGATESGDDWHLAFSSEPSHEKIYDTLRKDPWLAEELEAGCIQGWGIDKITVDE